MTPEPSHAYPRRILLAVTGLSPQVVTETLYALLQRDPSCLPTEVHLITTREGSERARLALLSEDPGWFRRFLRDFALTECIRFDADHIHVLTDANGEPLSDIRSPQDNERAADLITELVRQFTADDHAALHVSIAGGRKTMGYYLGYALSLYGRPQDRLSHVLVSEPFESSWEFFYPTPYERIIQVKGDKLANCQDARVTLAEIPFVRLREELPRRLLQGKARFSEVVAAAGRAWAEPRLRLTLQDRRVYLDDESASLGPTEFAFLYWLAQRAKRDEAEVEWSRQVAAEEFLRCASQVLNTAGGDYERIENALSWRLKGGNPKDLGDYFEPQKSRINKVFEQILGSHAARRYQICRSGAKGASRYSLPLSPEQIEIIE